MQSRAGIPFVVLGAAFAYTGCSGPSGAEELGASKQAIFGGVDDPDSDVDNVVVQLSSFTQACTGTLITPQIVLTAAHCVVGTTSTKDGAPFCLAGATGWINLGASPTGPSLRTHTGFPQTFARPAPCAPWDDAYRRQDIGLVFLQRPLSRAELDRLKMLQHIAMPTVVRPLFPNVGSPATLAIAGYSDTLPDGGVSPKTSRQTATGTWALASDTWAQPQPMFVATPGDSGGPLFQQLPGGSRQPVGVASSPNGYTNIASGENLQWILDRVRHAGPAAPPLLKHAPEWFTQHEKDPNDYWLGELDYAGLEPPAGMLDRDHDGWYDIHDNCPFVANADQIDKDNDGVGDACDTCPWDPYGDEDGDGVCLFQGDGVPAAEPDNCPLVPNDQKNCNHEAETANGKAVLGDACDPVPCAAGHAGQIFTGLTLPPARVLDCKKDLEPKYGKARVTNDTIYATRVAPHREEPDMPPPRPPVAEPLGATPTFGRFCQYDGSDTDGQRRETCKIRTVINDDELMRSNEDPRVPYDRSHPWRRVTMADVSRTGSWLWPYDDTESRSATYNQSHRWLFAQDWSDWTSPAHQRMIPAKIRPQYESLCTSLDGTCLDGRFWLHTQSANVPKGREDTRNNYFESRPDEAFGFGCSGIESPKVIWPWQKLDWVKGNWRRFIFDTLDDRGAPLSTPFVTDEASGKVRLVDDVGNPWDVSERLSAGVTAALRNDQRVVVPSLEPVTAPANVLRQLVAVVLSADGRQVADAIVQDDDALSLASESGIALGDLPQDIGHPRKGSLTVFSRAAGGVFVIGGVDEVTATDTTEVRFFRFGTGWTAFDAALFGTPKSAAYDAIGKRLWVFGERTTTGGRAQRSSYIDVVNPWSGSKDPSYAFTQSASSTAWDSHAMQVDTDGRLLFLASSSRKGTTKLVRLGLTDEKPSIQAYVATDLPPTRDMLLVDERFIGVVRRSADGGIDGVTRAARTTRRASASLDEMFR